MARESISVRVMSGPQDGLQIVLKLKKGQDSEWRIGRSEDNDIALTYDPQVSRTHARLFCSCNDDTIADGLDALHSPLMRLRLEDAGSRNGTYVGERKLRDEGVDLKPGDLFRVGRTWLRIDP